MSGIGTFIVLTGEFAWHVASSPLLAILALAVAWLTSQFVIVYWFNATKISAELDALTARCSEVENIPDEIKASLSECFRDKNQENQWREYSETLHEEHEWVSGERRIANVRATVPSQVFFSSESVIEPRIHSEFFKHLPGILTGIGIIGTFYGLVSGVQGFDPTKTNPRELAEGLKTLFTAVKYAFFYSGICIFLAISVTAIEKHAFAKCLKSLGALNEKLDALFRTGVGEEYLSRLVDAAQESASQTKQLKESLVADLKGLMTELAERQIAATNGISTSIGDQLTKSLQGPLEKIAETVRMASGDQSDRAGAVLEQIMTAFMEQMRQSMGNQISGLTTLLQGTADTLAKVELSMRGLVSDLRNAGGEQAQNLTEIARKLLADVAAQQERSSQVLDDSLTKVLSKLEDAIRRFVEVQEEAQARAKDALEANANAFKANAVQVSAANAEVLEKFASLAGEMNKSAAGYTETLQKTVFDQNDAITKQINALLQQLGEHRAATDTATQEATRRVLEELEKAIQKLVSMQEAAQKHASDTLATSTAHATTNAERVSAVTQDVIERMAALTEKIGATSNEAVTRLNSSADSLRRAVDGLSGATSQLESLVNHISDLQSATREVTLESKAAAMSLSTAGQYVASSVSELGGISERLTVVAASITTEAQVRTSTLAQIEGASRSAQEAGVKFVALTDEVKNALVGNLAAFSEGMTRTLQVNLSAYEQELGRAVSTLSGALDELSEFANRSTED